MQSKTCSNCKTEKSISEFQASRWYKDGYRGQCKACYQKKEYHRRPKRVENGRTRTAKLAGPEYDQRFVRDVYLKTRYGISLEQFEQMSEAQGHKCALCSFPASEMFHKTLYVDHCHKTGKVRGLLCWKCNTMLGHIGDDIASVSKLLDYVSKGA